MLRLYDDSRDLVLVQDDVAMCPGPGVVFRSLPQMLVMILKPQPTASAAVTLDLFEALAAHGLITEQDLSALGVSREQLMDVERRVPVTLIDSIWKVALPRNRIPQLGLLIGEQFNPVAHGVLAHLAVHAETLGEVLEFYQGHIGLMSEDETIDVTGQGDGVRVSHAFVNPDHDHLAAVERTLAAPVTWARQLTGVHLMPLEAGFRHDTVDYLDHYHRVFGDRVLFNQPADYLVLSRRDLDLPVRTSNAYLKGILAKRAEKIATSLAASRSLSSVVTELIEENLHRNGVTVQEIARRLNMSRQTLHRRLRQEGVNFRQLLTEVRKKRAVAYLKQRDCHIDKLREILGFEDASSFFKAFHNWFGMPPKAYRIHLREHA